MNAYNQGKQAYKDKKPAGDNPFNPGTEEFGDWNKGWNDEDDAMMDEDEDDEEEPDNDDKLFRNWDDDDDDDDDDEF